MPKNKAWGENSKAAEAKARKAETKKAEDEKKTKAAEDAYWQDDDAKLAKKQNRKEEQEKKRIEKLQKKTESKQMEQEEMERLAKTNQNATKITQAQIQAERERREAAARKASAVNKAPKPAPLLENLNRELPVDEVTTVDEALKVLTTKDTSSTPDRHPERRAKAAYHAFEEARLPILKAENPSLRLSQLKQLIFEEWKKSPENPMNQEHAEYNS
ncbi:unnamed protein product [Orchesella dallaii]|uniref:HMG box domain-containing protein n=1 Tax=Orchesella dallaii TaxID=48710 RepID=A0ABP1QTV9_9HEXA